MLGTEETSPQTFILAATKNNCGLQTDYEILKELLEAAGKTVHIGMAHDDVSQFPEVDVVIFLEIIDTKWFARAKQCWLFPNSEWWRQEWDCYIPRITKVLCKTKDCHDLWETRAPGRCVYLGFESRDFYNSEIPRTRAFLHLAGGSVNKGSYAVITAWSKYKIPYPLTVVGTNLGHRVNLQGSNATIISQLPDLRHKMNEHMFHILPSRYEGWGHVLHEGLSCGAVMLTTDAAPMNEATGLYKPILIPVSNIGHERVLGISSSGHCISNMYDVSPKGVYNCVNAAVALSADQISSISKDTRSGFLNDRAEFRSNLENLLRAEIDTSKLSLLPTPRCCTESASALGWKTHNNKPMRYAKDGLTVNWWDRHSR